MNQFPKRRSWKRRIAGLSAQREAQLAAVNEAAGGAVAPAARRTTTRRARDTCRAPPGARARCRCWPRCKGAVPDGMITAEDIPEHG